MDNLKSWNDFCNDKWNGFRWPEKYEATNIACPKCGHAVFRDTMIVLASYPPKSQYECKHCGWIGYA